MAPILSFLTSSGSKKKGPRCVRMSEAKASNSHRMCSEVSSSLQHFLQVGLFLSPISYKRLIKVLCPVRRPITSHSSDSLSTFGIIKSQYVLCKECEGAVNGLPIFSTVGQDKLVTCKRRCMNYRRKIRLKINMLGSDLQLRSP
jgi:hypothetical protein